MNNTGADIAISTLNKLTAQELAAASAASRDGNRPIYEISSTRYHAYLTAKDEIMMALAQPMRQLDQALAQIGSLPADPTNEPTKENKQ